MTVDEVKEVIDTLVHDQIEEIFSDVAEAFELESGDISPWEIEELENIESKLCQLIMKYLKNNGGII
jgi:hypothetical protein